LPSSALKVYRGMPRSWHSAEYWRVVVGIPQYVWARNAKGLRRSRGLWHSAEIWARNLAKDWIPVPAILHQQLPCLLRHNFLTHDFPAVKPWRGKLFRPKLSTQGLIWNSISWHYTFKLVSVFKIRLWWAASFSCGSGPTKFNVWNFQPFRKLWTKYYKLLYTKFLAYFCFNQNILNIKWLFNIVKGTLT
jgi:hypothetical protein